LRVLSCCGLANILKIVRLGAGDALDFGSPAVLSLEIFSG
jgi:hypothetical protein